MRALIVGAATATAVALRQHFRQRDYPIACTELEPAHLSRDEEGCCSLAIVDCAGQLAGQTLAFADFQQLVDTCIARGWPLLMVSDSRVFPALKNQRYRERDLTAPASAEGECLQQCERYLAEHSERHIILRTGPLLAASGPNLLTHLTQQMVAGGTIVAASEPRFSPAPVADLARVVAAMCDQIDCAAQCWGVYHYHSADTATFYELAEVVLAAASQYWDLRDRVQLKVEMAEAWGSEFPMLNCQKIRDTFGIQQMQWRKAIPDLLKQIKAGEAK